MAQGRRIDPDLQIGSLVESLQKSSNVLVRFELDGIVEPTIDRVTEVTADSDSGLHLSIERSFGNNLGHDVVSLVLVCAVGGHSVQDDLSELFHYTSLKSDGSRAVVRRIVKSHESKQSPGKSIEIVFACQYRVEEAVLYNHGRVENLRDRLIYDLSVMSQEKNSDEIHFTKTAVVRRYGSRIEWFLPRQNFSGFECENGETDEENNDDDAIDLVLVS